MALQKIFIYIRLFKAIAYILRFLRKQKNYNRAFVPSFLAPFQDGFKSNLDKNTERRIHSYYALAVPLLTNTLSILQKGVPLTDKEMRKAVLAGILTPIYDDLLDLNLIDTARQKEVLLYPENYNPIRLEDAISKKCLLDIQALGISQPDTFQRIKVEIYDSQIASLLQLQSSTSLEDLTHIMNGKSDSSLLFYYYLLGAEPNKGVEESIKFFGRLGQLSNDSFDVYKDYQEGIRTIPNTCEDFEQLEKDFTRGIRHFCSYTRALSFPKKQTERYLSTLVLILSTGLVVTQQFVRLQKKIGKGPLPFDTLPRKTFIGDMEKPANMLRTIKIAAQILAI